MEEAFSEDRVWLARLWPNGYTYLKLCMLAVHNNYSVWTNNVKLRDENGYHHVVMSKRMKNYDDKDNHKKMTRKTRRVTRS